MATPQPTPYGTSTKRVVSPQPAPAPYPRSNSGATDWNTQWNQIWNQAYNAGYNSGAKPQVDSSFSSAVEQGYSRGQSDFRSKQTTPTNPTQISSNNLSNITDNINQPNPQAEAERLANEIRSQISGGYDSYFSNLNTMLDSSLPSQFSLQNQMIEANRTQNINDLTAQKTMEEANLNAESVKNQGNQVKSLKDIASNIRNLFQTGNTYLGSRGAGDSSAVNQYSYALTKLGSRQRGDVLSQTRTIENEIDSRRFKLGTIYNNEVNKINYEAQAKGLEVANWLYQEQDRLKGMIAQGNLSKSQDLANLSTNLYNQAVSKLSTYQNEIAQKRVSLENWALANSQTIGQLKANLQQISDYQAENPYYQTVSGTPRTDAQGNIYTQFRGGGTGGYYNNDDDLFS